MRKREKNLKSAMSHRQEEESEVSQAPTVISSDEDEGNEDLSLKIVEKALLRACQKTTSDAAPLSLSSSPPLDDRKAVKTRRKLKKKSPQETTMQQVDVVDLTDEKDVDISEVIQSAEKDPVENSDSLVLRKLLRGPRYFDPPDSGGGWGACYNCGEEGHTSINCTKPRQKRPCFICGSLDHHVKQCMKGQDCYICQKGGHHAKDCPENYKRCSKSLKICLKCGDSGNHDMFSCKNDYSPEDLKGIQCYICKIFGHLCCADFIETSPGELSCYRCGQLGHGGLDCGKSHTEKNNVRSTGKCYVCQEIGHIAKNCPSSIKDHRKSRSEKALLRSSGICHGCGEEGHIVRDCPSSTKDGGESRSKSCYICGKEGHIARECLLSNEGEKRKSESSTPTRKEKIKFKKAKSSNSENFKAQKKTKYEYEENQYSTPYSLKKRGGWTTEDPIDLSSPSQARQWYSPVTPVYNKNNMVYTPGANGREFYLDDNRYGSNYRHGPSQQRFDHYGDGPSSEPYRHFRSNESYHHYGPYRHGEFVPSSRPNHQYVVSPPHHQSYLSSGSPNFSPQGYPTRFHNSSSDGVQRIRHRNR